jgi:2-oxoglutarate ferredoxin oxidoreductase subunit delta
MGGKEKSFMAKGRIEIDETNCKGCTLCQIACPQQVIMMSGDRVNVKGYNPAMLVDPDETCTGCALCAVACPDVCITVYRQMPSKVQRAAAAV